VLSRKTVLSRKPILLALAFGCGLQLLAEPAGSDEPVEGSPPASKALNATVLDGEMIGWEQYRRVFMAMGGQRMVLVVPQDFRADIGNPEKVVLVNHDYSCVLSFRLVASGSAAVAALNADLGRAWLSARLGELKIQEEFSQSTTTGSGPAFDLTCKVDGVARAARVAFIASPFGVLEFTSLSSPEKFEAAKANLRYVLRSFRIGDANGKLEIPPAARGDT
jgi:hypothetical protein